jgi:hypothetical protein
MLFYYSALVMGRVKGFLKIYPLFMESVHAVFLILFKLDGAGIFAILARGKMRHPW